MNDAALKVKISHVSKIFSDKRLGDVVALEDINMTINQGEVYCLLGPSGCGKSTLLNMVAGFINPTHGVIEVDGKAVKSPGPERAMVFQQPTLYPWLNVLNNVRLGLDLAGDPDSLDKAMHYIKEIGLEGFEYRYPYELSGGMQQRVGIARAWVNTPSVLLLDEPFGALDAQTRLAMQSLLLDLWMKHQTTILFITHDIDEAIFIGDRIGVMSRNPGALKREIEVDLSRPRTLEDTTSKAFIDIKNTILSDLYSEAH